METTMKRRTLSRGPAIPGIVTLVGLGTIAAVVFAVLYAAAANYNPLQFLTFIAACLCGYGTGRTIQFAARIGGIRNRAVKGLLALLLGILAVYVSWVAYLAIGTRIEYYNPVDMLHVLHGWGANGLWTVAGQTPTGMTLYALWCIEALLIVAFTVVFSLRGTATAAAKSSKEIAADASAAENAQPADGDS